MREVVLDTETTGLDPAQGHRLVEIACVEVQDYVPTGRTFHSYLDPERDVPEEAYRIHGLSRNFLAGKPQFRQVYVEFLEFVDESRLVIHNAEFDMKFVNAELQSIGVAAIPMDRAFDTLAYARRKFPGASNSLDALCARFRIDNSKRTRHGALLDAEILAEVYIELMGGRQTALELAVNVTKKASIAPSSIAVRQGRLRSSLDAVSMNEHESLRMALGPEALWRRYVDS